MITFIVVKDDNKNTIQFSNDGTMLDLKKEIIKLFDLKCKYIDIISEVDRPIRVMGKFNFDKGLQPRTLDNYEFNRFGIDERTIPITFEEVEDFKPFVKKASANTGDKSTYVPPNGSSYVEELEVEFDINSESDFPSL
jgi:hypothetical protein